ncbi:MAG TPA: hypothetical protein VMA32_08165 [Streptosporangiaceae bacterium]|nr:hypothetical protein [Streptosporangiaceae bacterium]
MTASKDVVIRRALAAAAQAGPPQSSRLISRRDRASLRTSAGLALTATGLICALAVHIHESAVNVQTLGIIVTALGIAWLWIPVQGKSALLRRQRDRVRSYLAWDPAEGSTVRCSLNELLGPQLSSRHQTGPAESGPLPGQPRCP